MATIGSFGKLIIFETSDKKILNFKNFQRTVSGEWATHERVGKKSMSEFLRPGLDTGSFTITLNAQHGVKPRQTLENIEAAIKTGRAELLVIGSKKVGDNKFKITQMSETWDTVLFKGELMKATLSISIEEYL